MEKQTFSKIRTYLGKTQLQMSQLMGTSVKSIQSFEQGWRNITPHIERQAYFLLSRKALKENTKLHLCWEMRKCPDHARLNCPAWEFKCGDLCWFINGTICDGEAQKSWQNKIIICQQCEVFQQILPFDLQEG